MKSDFQGSALLIVVGFLFVSALIASQLFALTHQAWQPLQIQAQREKSVESLRQSLITSLSDSSVALQQRTLRQGPCELKQVRVTDSASALTQSLYLLDCPGPRRPDWSVLEQQLSSVCEEWNTNSVPGTISPSQSCLRLPKLSQSTFVRGNLLSDSLTLEGPSSSTLVLAVLGNLSLNTLDLRKLQQTSISILVLGDIEIASLTLTQSTDLDLLLFSQQGKISLASLAPEFSLCVSGATAQRLELVAAEEILLGGKQLTTSGRLGCELERPSLLWPEKKLLGHS